MTADCLRVSTAKLRHCWGLVAAQCDKSNKIDSHKLRVSAFDSEWFQTSLSLQIALGYLFKYLINKYFYIYLTFLANSLSRKDKSTF